MHFLLGQPWESLKPCTPKKKTQKRENMFSEIYLPCGEPKAAWFCIFSISKRSPFLKPLHTVIWLF